MSERAPVRRDPAGGRWPRRGVDVRPVAIRDDVDDAAVTKPSGVVVLPRHIRWSEPSRRYDPGKRADAISGYEQVLQEGTGEDARALIKVDRLIDL